MNMLFKCMLFFTIAQITLVSCARKKDEYVVCYKEIGEKTGYCNGKYCYKTTYFSDDETNGITKKSCTNGTDAQITLNECNTRIDESQASKEILCYCDSDFCNTTFQPSIYFSIFCILLLMVIQ